MRNDWDRHAVRPIGGRERMSEDHDNDEQEPNDEKPRLRVAFATEAENLLATLEPEDAVPCAVAFYAGLRRSEINRLE
jgi:hypothetical protein